MEPAIVEPRETILGSGAGGPLTAPGPWIQYHGYLAYDGGLVIGNASGGFKGPGAVNLKSIYLDGAQFLPSNYLALAGGTLTGPLNLAADPTASFQATTKNYVDNLITTVNGTFASYLPLVGGTMTGFLTLSAAPTADLHAATKKYVDDKSGSVITIPDAPSDGNTYGRNNAAWAIANQIDVGTY